MADPLRDNPAFEDHAFIELATRYLDGVADDAAVEALTEALRDSDDHRQAFAMLSYEGRLLGHVHRGATQDAPAVPVVATVRPAGIDTRSRFVLALAAAVMMAAAALAVYSLVFSGGAAVDDEPMSAPIATLIDATGTVLVNDDVANPGSDYRSGDYAVESGSAHFQLTSGATVHLRTGTRLVMQGAMRSRLVRGAASFDCPESAHGYTVDLPDGGRVVDLGTRFGVRVDDVNDEVHLFVGSVRIERGDESRVLTAPAAVRFVEGGIEAIEPDVWRFPDVAIERDALIATVDFNEPGAGWRAVDGVQPMRDGAIVLDGGADKGEAKQSVFVDLDTSADGPLASLELVDADGRIGRVGPSLWLSWTMRGANKDSVADGWAGLSLFDGSDDRRSAERVFIGKASGYRAFSYSMPGGSRVEDLDVDPAVPGRQLRYTDDKPHRFVARVEFSAPTTRISVWIDPAAGSLGPAHAEIDAADLRFDRLRFEAGGGSGVWTFDDLKIGPTRRSVSVTQEKIE